jgi:hypothetical protein
MVYILLIFLPFHYRSKADRKHLKVRCWRTCDATIPPGPQGNCCQYNSFDASWTETR